MWSQAPDNYYGAGVYVHNSTFNMYGGAIRGNAASWGGGVAALGSTFNMYGGVISDNMVSASAGGVLLSDKSVMNMSGNAQISNNIAPTKWTTSGGGVYIFASTDGEVSNCLYMSDNAENQRPIQPLAAVLCMYVKRSGYHERQCAD